MTTTPTRPVEARPRTRVMIVEDHPMVAQGMAVVMGQEPDLAVVAVAATVGQAKAMAEVHQPDVIVMDQMLPDGKGTDAAGEIRDLAPRARVLIVSAEPEHGLVADAIAAGCAGCLSKTRTAADLVRAVRSAATDGTYVSADMLNHLVERQARWDAGVDVSLSPRELDVLALVSEGRTNRAIAEALGLSANTVGNHVQRILTKLGAHSKLEALVTAVQLGLVRVPGAGSNPPGEHRPRGDT